MGYPACYIYFSRSNINARDIPLSFWWSHVAKMNTILTNVGAADRTRQDMQYICTMTLHKVKSR